MNQRILMLKLNAILILMYTFRSAFITAIQLGSTNRLNNAVSRINLPFNSRCASIESSLFPVTLKPPERLSQRYTTRSYVTRTPLVMMPEGPEVRTISSGVNRVLKSSGGHNLVSMSVLSGRYTKHGDPKGWGEMIESLNKGGGKKVEEWKCKGKFQVRL